MRRAFCWHTEAGPTFRRVEAPTPAALDLLVHTLSEHIARHLERRGLLARDDENEFLTVDARDDATLDELCGHLITYRFALGPYAGRKAFTLQTLPSASDLEDTAARVNGFSLHAGVLAATDERTKLKRLCRTITRHAVSTERLSLTAQGLIYFRLKTPYRDGTTYLVFEPLDTIAGSDFAPPQACPKGEGHDARHALSPESPPWCRIHASMSCAQRLKRAFKFEVETCEICGGQMKVIPAYEDPAGR